MTILQSVLLGMVQGLTEFFPVSSFGHLAVLQNMFHIRTDDSLLFDVMLHLGTLAAVLLVYRRDIGKMTAESLFMVRDLLINSGIWMIKRVHKTSFQYRKIISNGYRKFIALLLVSTAPTAVIGYLGQNFVKQAGGTLLLPGICFLITAVLLMMADTARPGHKQPRDLNYRDALKIGLAQGASVLPGLSRFGVTVTACILCGLEQRFAVKYSFLLSIPAVCGAALLEAGGVDWPAVTARQAAEYAAGMISAAVVGCICIRLMLLLTRKKNFRYFAVYCVLAAAVAVGGHFFL